jgi:hypothetical protein
LLSHCAWIRRGLWLHLAHNSGSIARRENGNASSYKPILGAFPALIALNVKLNYCANCNLCALILSQEAVTVNEEVACESV